jgi:hypothetical protein
MCLAASGAAAVVKHRVVELVNKLNILPVQEHGDETSISVSWSHVGVCLYK